MSDREENILYRMRSALLRLLPDIVYIKVKYRRAMKKRLDLKQPKTFNEKLNWLKLYDRKPIYSTLVDKYAVKQYVADIIGEKHIIPTLGIWNSYDEIDFEKLPSQFVLKCTHDSGSVKIIRDKDTINHPEYKKYFNKRISNSFYYHQREWAYKNVEPKIIAEEFISFAGEKSLIDYKFFCFNNDPKLLYISTGLEDHSTAKISFYDLNGNEMPFHRSDFRPYHNAVLPKNFSQMVELAKQLSKEVPCPFIRIDLYSNGEVIYFSEYTFFPNGGLLPFTPEEWDFKLGEMLDLHIE